MMNKPKKYKLEEITHKIWINHKPIFLNKFEPSKFEPHHIKPIKFKSQKIKPIKFTKVPEFLYINPKLPLLPFFYLGKICQVAWF